MNRYMKLLIILISSVATFIQLEAAAVKITNQEAFIQELKSSKRLVAVIADGSQFASNTQAPSSIDLLVNTLNAQEPYKLSRINFIRVNVEHLPEDTRAELLKAVGGQLKEPVTGILFENGNLVNAEGLSVPLKDVQDHLHDVLVGFHRVITQNWGGYIEHSLHKCDRADARRAFAHAKKVQVALAQNVIDQQGYVIDTNAPNYDPAQYGYGQQQAYENSNGNMYYNYPYYNAGVVPAVGLGVGLGYGADYLGGYYGGRGWRHDGHHQRDGHHHHGGHHEGGHHGGGHHGRR